MVMMTVTATEAAVMMMIVGAVDNGRTAMVVNGRRWSTMLTIRRAIGQIFGAFDDR